MSSATDDRTFITQYTRLQSPPHTPELQLHLAGDLELVWHAMHRRSGHANEPIPFWAFAWPGGLALARHLLDHPDLVKGKRVLDLATGSGLCAIAAAMAGATAVMAADIDAICAAAVAINAEANQVTVSFTECNVLDDLPPPVDLIVVGDIGYERDLAERMLTWLGDAHRIGIDVLIGDPERRYFPVDAMTRLAVDLVETSTMLEAGDRTLVGIYTFPDPT